MSEVALAFTLKTVSCCVCHVAFAFAKDLYNQRLKDHAWFYCPNGHAQHFQGEAEVDRLKRQLEEQRNRTVEYTKLWEHEQRSKAVYRGKLKALKGRIKNGVCPCCHRSFVQLARHMATKHPNYGPHSVEG